MKDTNLCIKFTILERCLHYLMITPGSVVSLTKWLEEDLLSLPLLTKSIAVIFFAEKIVRSFCNAKASYFFFSKKCFFFFFFYIV